MQSQIFHFTNANTNKLIFMHSNSDSITNKDKRHFMKQLLSKAIFSELTEQQRICIIEHYFNKRKQKDIASELGLNASTVSRHINAGKKKLRNIASYYI